MTQKNKNQFKNYFIYSKKLLKREIYYSSIKPTHALLIMTYRCTSKCKMCTIWQRGKNINKNDELTLDEWKKVIDKIFSKHLEVVEIFGGDSLLRKDVTIPLIEYIAEKNKNIIIDMPTNCNLLDKKTALDLVKSGLYRIYISLDGPIDTHDKIRGNIGTFNRVNKAIDYLVEAKKELKSKTPIIIVNCTISKTNVDNFEKIIPEAEKLGVDAVEFEYTGEFKDDAIQNTNVQGIKPTPFYINTETSNLVNLEQAHILKKKLKEIKETAKSLKISILTEPVDVLTIDNLVNGKIPNKKCYFSRYTISIDPFGNIIGCFHFNNYIIGNIKNMALSSIWNNKKHQSFFKAQKKGDIKMCKNCISGVRRNLTLCQYLYRKAYFYIKGKGFDEP